MLRAWMRERGLNVVTFCEKYGLNRITVAKWVQGKGLPRAAGVARIEQITGIGSEHWLTKSDVQSEKAPPSTGTEG